MDDHAEVRVIGRDGATLYPGRTVAAIGYHDDFPVRTTARGEVRTNQRLELPNKAPDSAFAQPVRLEIDHSVTLFDLEATDAMPALNGDTHLAAFTNETSSCQRRSGRDVARSHICLAHLFRPDEEADLISRITYHLIPRKPPLAFHGPSIWHRPRPTSANVLPQTLGVSLGDNPDRTIYDGVMRKTLRAHISTLEERIESLHLAYGMTHTSKAERDQIFAQIKTAEAALDHYRKAHMLERKVMKSKPS